MLNLGCGNAIIQEEMYEDGYKSIDNIDISEVCVQQMKGRSKDRPGLKCKFVNMQSTR